MAKKAAITKTTAKKRVYANRSKSRVREVGRARSAVGREPKQAPLLTASLFTALKSAPDQAKLFTALKSVAKTPEQHADVGVVGLAQQHLEKGEHETAESLTGKVGNWVAKWIQEHSGTIGHIIIHNIRF